MTIASAGGERGLDRAQQRAASRSTPTASEQRAERRATSRCTLSTAGPPSGAQVIESALQSGERGEPAEREPPGAARRQRRRPGERQREHERPHDDRRDQPRLGEVAAGEERERGRPDQQAGGARAEQRRAPGSDQRLVRGVHAVKRPSGGARTCHGCAAPSARDPELGRAPAASVACGSGGKLAANRRTLRRAAHPRRSGAGSRRRGRSAGARAACRRRPRRAARNATHGPRALVVPPVAASTAGASPAGAAARRREGDAMDVGELGVGEHAGGLGGGRDVRGARCRRAVLLRPRRSSGRRG